MNTIRVNAHETATSAASSKIHLSVLPNAN